MCSVVPFTLGTETSGEDGMYPRRRGFVSKNSSNKDETDVESESEFEELLDR